MQLGFVHPRTRHSLWRLGSFRASSSDKDLIFKQEFGMVLTLLGNRATLHIVDTATHTNSATFFSGQYF